ncbi:hypothetical protein L9F63_027906, partial [Diploptera punctata]
IVKLIMQYFRIWVAITQQPSSRWFPPQCTPGSAFLPAYFEFFKYVNFTRECRNSHYEVYSL